jgi:thiosulfate reductase cytochrome b subunit
MLSRFPFSIHAYATGMKRRRPRPTYRHSLVTRITHAVFFVAFAGLLVTGTQLYFHRHWLPRGINWHEYFGLAMIAAGATYFAGALLSGSLSKLLFSANDARGIIPMVAYYLRLRKAAPVYTDYNPLQKLAYTIVLLTMGPMMAATGLALWPHLPLFRPLTQFFGGRNAVTMWHLGFALELVVFFLGHMLMVATTGLRNNLSAIITGWHYPDVAKVPVIVTSVHTRAMASKRSERGEARVA